MVMFYLLKGWTPVESIYQYCTALIQNRTELEEEKNSIFIYYQIDYPSVIISDFHHLTLSEALLND